MNVHWSRRVEQRWRTAGCWYCLSVLGLHPSLSEHRSSFIALSACPERPKGAAEWPVAPLTLRAAVTLHHPTLHLGRCGHLATRARVRRSWTRGYWEINRYASAQPSELPGWLAGCLLPTPSPCYGQMKTVHFSLFHTSLYVDILLHDKKCLC